MRLLTREDFIQPRARLVEPIDVPELGGRVYIRELEASEKADWELKWVNWKEVNGGDMCPDFEPFFAVFVLCDKEGKTILTVNDVPMLRKLPGPAMIRIWRKARTLNNLVDEEIERAAKNSANAPASSGGSASPHFGDAPSGKPCNGGQESSNSGEPTG